MFLLYRMTYSSFMYASCENRWDLMYGFTSFDKAFKYIQTLSPKVKKIHSSKYTKNHEYVDEESRTQYRIEELTVKE